MTVYDDPCTMYLFPVPSCRRYKCELLLYCPKLHIESSIVLVIYLKYCLLFATAQKTGPAFIHPIEEDENDDLTADDTFPPSGAFHILAFSPFNLNVAVIFNRKLASLTVEVTIHKYKSPNWKSHNRTLQSFGNKWSEICRGHKNEVHCTRVRKNCPPLKCTFLWNFISL